MIYLKKIKNIITNIENSNIPFTYFILTFFFIVTLRNFLELFSSSTDITIGFFLHVYAFYVSIALAMILLFYYATKERIDKISKVVLTFFSIIIIPPIIDLLFSFGKGYLMTYLFPGTHENLLLRFFTFFGSFDGVGITPGIRIEIGLVLLGSFIYFYIKKKNIMRNLFFTLLIYILFFTFAIMPFIAQALLNLLNLDYSHSNSLMSNIYLLLIFIFSNIILFIYNKKYFIELLKDIRFSRVAHYVLMFFLGIIIAGIVTKTPFQLTQEILFSILLIIIAIIYSALFSIITNNITDYKIDKISNKKRPSVTKAIPLNDYKKLSWIFLILAFIYSIAAGFVALFLITLIIGNFYLYSMPPLRLKRIPFLSKLALSLNSLIMVVLGYYLITGTFELPILIVAFFLIFITAAFNFIDLKDYEGDKKAGIKTIPVLLGLKKSKTLIGIFFLILYISIYFFLNNIYLLIPLTTLGIMQFYFINRTKYNEKPISIIYLVSLIFLLIYLIAFPITTNIYFPDDENSHPKYENEWWYFNGHLQDQFGNNYGVMNVLFKSGLSYFILIDKENQKYYSFKHIGTFDENKIASGYMSWENLGNFSYLVRLNSPEINSSFSLISNKEPFLIGGEGLVEFGEEGFSYYYSLTDVDMEASIRTVNKTLSLTGKGWIDRQWGNWTFVKDHDNWEWWSIKLDDGTDIMAFKVMLGNELITPLLNIQTKDNKNIFTDKFNVEYLNSWTDNNGYVWSDEWIITSKGNNHEINLSTSLDFKEQFFEESMFEGSGTTKGTMNRKPVKGQIFFEKIYVN
tara:strand:- start:50 stop:2443 length:2394 start_codon:yes stop_codon:yes gene_type:complete